MSKASKEVFNCYTTVTNIQKYPMPSLVRLQNIGEIKMSDLD